ncbi:MAG: MATE family efflux transporter, partial [Oscillospiraceae bacterium]|nr:MATE family efflux transporter [Oscillospiraceae bacterium]
MVDFTEGKVYRTLISFSLPLLMSTILQQLYNIADSMIIGNFAGTASLAAVGAGYPITLVFVAIATGTSMGCAVVISEIFGEGEKQRLRQAIVTAMIAFAVLGVVLAAGGSLLSGPLLHLLNAEGEVFNLGQSYLAIYAVGVFPMMVYNTITGIFTGVGDSRLPFIVLLISSVLNVILDLIAVGPLELGVVGAAWATTISQLAAAVISLFFLYARLWKSLPAEGEARFSFPLLGQIANASVPCILQQGSVAIGTSIMQSVVNGYGTSIIAGYEAAAKLHNFAYMSMNTLGTALASFVAQCCGARRYNRVREGFRASLVICLIITVCVAAIFVLFPKPLVS